MDASFDIYDHFPLIAAFSFFMRNVFLFYWFKGQVYDMQHLILFVFVAELIRSSLRFFISDSQGRQQICS